jgi:hypothetical protein
MGWILGNVLCAMVGLPRRGKAPAPAFAPAEPTFVDRGRAAIGLAPLRPSGVQTAGDRESTSVFGEPGDTPSR